MDESGTDEAECSIKVTNGRRVASAYRFLVCSLKKRGLEIRQARRMVHDRSV